jgi:hypothetical protein
MNFDREGVLFKDGTGWYWPFPRLLFRLRNGYWCTHKRPVKGGRTFVAPGDEWTISIETEPAWVPSSEGRPDGWVRIDYQIGTMMRRCEICHWAETK